MREIGSDRLKGSFAEIARMVGCFPEEAARCIVELQRTETARVTLGNDCVTLVSRYISKEIKAKKLTNLRVKKHRRNARVTHDVTDRVISNKKEVIREEKKPAAIAAPAEDPVERRIWKDGIDLLSKSALTEKQARPFLGRLAKDYGNEKLAEAIAVTQAKNPVDPKVFLIGVLKTGEKDRARMELGKYVPDDKPYIPDPPCTYCGKEICFSLHEEERQKEAA